MQMLGTQVLVVGVHFCNVSLAVSGVLHQVEEQLKQGPMDLASGLLALWPQVSEATGLLGP